MYWVVKAAVERYQVPMPDGRLYYTSEAESPAGAVTSVAQRLKNKFKKPEESEHIYLDRLLGRFESQAIPWPSKYPELQHAQSVVLLKEIEKNAPDMPVDGVFWEKIKTAGQQWGIPVIDEEGLEWFAQKMNMQEQVKEAQPEQLELFGVEGSWGATGRIGFFMSPTGQVYEFPVMGPSLGSDDEYSTHIEYMEGIIERAGDKELLAQLKSIDMSDWIETAVEHGWTRGAVQEVELDIHTKKPIDWVLSQLATYNNNWLLVRTLQVDEMLNAIPIETDAIEAWKDRGKVKVVSSSKWVVQAYYKDTQKEHPAAGLVGSWKATHKMKYVNMDKLQEIMSTDKAFVSAKMDGELVGIWYQDGKVETITYKGTMRSNFPAVEEAGKLIKAAGYKTALFMAEMYAVDEKSHPISYMKSSTIIRNPESGKDHQLRLAVFDLIQLDGKEYLDIGIDGKMEVIRKVFDKGELIKPVHMTEGGIETAEEMWNQLDEKGWEGLVVYLGSLMYKVKPITSYDMVVVAIYKSPKYVDRMGAVLCAFMDKEGRFRLNGAVGGGFTDQEKVWIWDWAHRHKVAEDDDRIWVDPYADPIIVEVEAAEVNMQNRPKLDFKNDKWVTIENDLGGLLRFPHLKRIRDDKEPTHRDVPVEQLPIREEPQK